ncbi:hypothetical protein ACTHPF_17620 [Paenibacillus sp. SAF-054]|uniref:hypothetical protein n=1 Tax=unclassified Paenibacillus TaxID=185978 RepID=UPI003F80509D
MKTAGIYEQLIDSVTALIYEDDPTLLDRYGEKGVRKCKEDNAHHLRHLETAWALQNEKIFTDYAIWLNGILVKYGMSTRMLIINFRFIKDALPSVEGLDKLSIQAYEQYLTAAIEVLGQESGLSALTISEGEQSHDQG